MDHAMWFHTFADKESDHSIFVSSIILDGEHDPTHTRLRQSQSLAPWSADNHAKFIWERNRLTDNLECAANDYKVVSQPLMEFLAPRLAGQAEFFPLPLIGSKSRKRIDGYFLLHPLTTLDALDLDKTPIHPLRDDLSKVLLTGAPVLDRRRIPEGINIFRLQRIDELLISLELAYELKASPFTGLRFGRMRYE